ncbi:MAG TPA: SDR family NAD(P)-dependent oxidoreductase [Bryobacteraceae bacterium]|nr:SDR family NAD(P)-dependent oxidoreductase [Bryobacteraceae bacterium]
MSDRVVLISGATGGLGTAVTERFRSAGDRVVALGRGAGDLTSPAGADAVVADTMSNHGRIDALIHVLGGFAGGKPVSETEDATWTKMINLNLNSAFYLCRAVLRQLDRGGRIVAIGSRTGVQPASGLSAYGASKAALNALIQTIALEVQDQGITANVVLPSVIDTEANRQNATAEQIAKWVSPESIAGVVYFLCSEEASHINGALIPVYGRA